MFGEGQVKLWRREISPCGSVRRIPQGSLRQITEIFRILPIHPPSFALALNAPRSPLARFSLRSIVLILLPLFCPSPCSLARPLRQPVLRLVRSVSLTSCWIRALPLTAAMVPLLPANGVESCRYSQLQWRNSSPRTRTGPQCTCIKRRANNRSVLERRLLTEISSGADSTSRSRGTSYTRRGSFLQRCIPD